MQRDHKKERGQSLTELALSLVFMLLLFGGVIDLGRAFFTFIALRDATQEGAIFGSYCPWDTANITSRIQNSATGTWINSQMVEIEDITRSPNSDPGSVISVHTSVDFEISMPFLGAAVGTQTIPIHTTVTDTILKNTNPCTN